MYIRREIESTIDAMLTQGKVVLITGARQVGKTTVLKEHLGGSFSYVSMENPRDYLLAKQDAVLFFDSHELPLIVDEVQRVPELFSPVKWIVDQSDQKGRIVLTGSQTYHLMKGVSESLAGRIRIIEMPPLSLRELIGSASSPHPYVPARITEPKHVKGLDIWSVIHRGSMPELQDSSVEWDSFYSDYVSAYLERDVRDLINVQDEAKFYSFMVACAARSGQLLNATDIGNAIDVDHKTVKAWLSVLQASNIVKVIQPFWPNVDKRLSKTPKIFFMDTGLVCHLTRWTTPEQLRNGAVAGHVFETFVVSEVLKSYMNAGANLRDVWFYRDAKKREIDLVIQDGHVLHPVEVKTAATVGSDAVKNFGCLDRLSDYEVGFGHVVCQTDEPYLVTRDVQAVPVWEL
ncbi:AAA+ superfamily ATPase [Schaalia cardiffensis F0333]|uniref:AAA+ superfamily ATPase n=1 Tax=Schaalia cardiffensis F0333 TaxID=888050 RepID=N6WAX0_9ACTO|nr:ATP-binding protein [Schaalia cardiffensis]ENO17399.1 AAA+ superfamily ATPase [Schaalia cardiffensis F0333]